MAQIKFDPVQEKDVVESIFNALRDTEAQAQKIEYLQALISDFIAPVVQIIRFTGELQGRIMHNVARGSLHDRLENILTSCEMVVSSAEQVLRNEVLGTDHADRYIAVASLRRNCVRLQRDCD